MGQQNTKREVAVGQLNHEEFNHLKKLFNSISTTNIKGEKGPYCLYSDLQKHCENYLDDWLARRIADRICTKTPKGDHVVSLSTFLQFVSNVVKGTLEEKINVVWQLAIDDSPEIKSEILPEEILQYARSIIESYIKCMEKSSVAQSWIGCAKLSCDSVSDYAEYLLSDLFYSGVTCKEMVATKPSKATHKKEEILDCFSKSHLMLSIHDSIFSQCFDVDKETAFIQLIPRCIKTGAASQNSENYTILDLARIIFLNTQLPSSQYRREWRFLFSTNQHGESFSKLLGSIQGKGPTLLVLKEHRGRVFGAFASHAWALGPKFYGDETSFLFHLDPKFAVYPATGYNNNFQYMNVQQQTLPNGLGMGGKFGYFGLWIDAEFGTGKGAPTCTTFSSPQLSTEEDFLIHHLEVWGLGPEPEKEEGERDTRSCLDKDPESKMMLEMLNRGGHSEAHRDEPKD